MPITLRPVEPGTAIFDGGVTFKTSYGGVIDLRDCQYVVLDSLTITRSGWFGVLAERSKYIQIINCDISWCYASGIMCDRCEDVLVSGCNLQKCTHGVPDQAAPNEWISMRGVHRFTVQTCHLHNPHLVNGTKVGKEGIDAKTGSMDGIIENNIVQDMRRLGIYVDAYDAGCTNILVRSNLVERCQHGIVLSSERGGDLENITVVSNVCQDNQYHGLWVAHDPDDLTGEMFNITVRSNTSTQNQGVGIRISNPNLHNCTITDNDLTQNAKGPVQWSIKDKSGVTYANNRES